MKLLKSSLIRCKTILLFMIFCVMSFILGTKLNLSKTKFNIDSYSCYAVSTDCGHYNSAHLAGETTVLYPQVLFDNDNKNLEKKINSLLNSYFVNYLDGIVIYKGKK